MKYHEMTKNYIFREFECGLTREQTAELCFKSVRAVTDWDKGKPIPPECKRLMRISKGRQLSSHPNWCEFEIKHDKLRLPNGQLVTPQQVILGIALLEINSDLENRICTDVLKFARIIAKLKNT